MGALTVTLKSADAWLSLGNRRGVIASMTGSTSYATNGETYTARNFGLGTIDRLQIISEPKGYAIKVDQTNSKIIYSDTSGFTPAGTVAAPVLTMNAYTPAGTVAAPALTMNSYTPAGTNAAPTLNSVNVTVTGGQAAGAALQILPDSAAGVLGKTTATTFNIPQATLGIPVATANAPAFTGTAATLTGTNSAPAFTGTAATLTGTNSAPVFTGTAVAAGLFAEVASTTDVSAQSFDVIAWGW